MLSFRWLSLTISVQRLNLDFIHLIDKKKRQDKLISPTKEKSHAYLATRDYDRFAAFHASL
jgi:hypothetical protein